MRIGIINTCIPFVYGGAEMLAESLREKLEEHGHQARIIEIPFQWYPPQKLLEQMLACRLLSLDAVDRIIPLKFPVYYLSHPNKVVWLLHQHRQAYDLWGTAFQDIPDTPDGLRIRHTIMQSDNLFLNEGKAIYCISHVVTDRLKRFNGIDSEVLYPPLMDSEKYHLGQDGDYLFFPSRIARLKRQSLAVEAMKYTKSGVRLVIAGGPDTPADLEDIEAAVNKNGLSDKVRILGKWVPQDEKIKLMADSLGCVFIPHDEDYGYVTLEAFYSRKPLITCEDSGGPLEFVEDGVTGLVARPDAKSIAQAMDRLYSDRAAARRMGLAGYEKVISMGIGWDRVIERLTR